jgi:hypothetical protein
MQHSVFTNTICVQAGVSMELVGDGCCDFNNILYKITSMATKKDCTKTCDEKPTCYGAQTRSYTNNEDDDEVMECKHYMGLSNRRSTEFGTNKQCNQNGGAYQCYKRRDDVDEEDHVCLSATPEYEDAIINIVEPKLPVPYVVVPGWEYEAITGTGAVQGTKVGEVFNVASINDCAEHCASKLQCSKWSYYASEQRCFMASATATALKASDSDVKSGYINKKCASDPDAHCAVPFEFSVSYFQTEVCIFVFGIDPNAADFYDQFIALIVRLNAGRPEFDRLGEAPNTWSSWTDGHILEQQIFQIEQNHGNYWYFKKQIYMRTLCQPDRRKRRSAETNTAVAASRLTEGGSFFTNFIQKGKMQLPEYTTVVSMEHPEAEVAITTEPESVDGESESGTCERKGGEMACGCNDGYTENADGTCSRDDMPLVKSAAFSAYLDSFFLTMLSENLEQITHENKHDRHERWNTKLTEQFSAFWDKFELRDRSCEASESQVGPDLKQAVFDASTHEDFRISLTAVVQAKLGDCDHLKAKWGKRVKMYTKRLNSRVNSMKRHH